MSSEVGNIHWSLDLDDKKFNQGINDSSKNAKKLANDADNLSKKWLESTKTIGQSAQNLGKNMTIGLTLPIVGLGVAAFKLASDMNETINKVDVAFEDSADYVKNWSKTSITQMGLAAQTALDSAALFGDMATSMGFGRQEAAEMSTSMVQLAADMSSFKNIPIEQAITALNGAFTGETESLKRLGIVMTQANLESWAMTKGIKVNWEEMSQAEKVSLRYKYILDVTKNAQGDFARTSDGAANQTRMFKEQLKQLGASFGEVILPAILPTITKLNELVKNFQSLDNDTKKFIITVGGILAALGPIIYIFGKLLSSISAVATFFGSTGLGGAIVTFLSGPVGWVILGIVAVIAACILLKDELKKLWQEISVYVIPVWNQLVDLFKTIVLPVLTWVWDVITKQLLPALTEFWNKNKDDLIPILKILGAIVGLVLVAGLAALGIAIIAVGAIVGGIIWLVTKIIEGFTWWREQTERLTDWFNNLNPVIQAIVNPIGAIINAVKELIRHWDDLKRTMSSVPSTPIAGLKKVLGLAKGGSVRMGEPYIVGEEGPELFVPGTSGKIIPNDATTSIGSGGGQIINNLTLDVGMFAGTPQELRTIAEKLNIEMSRLTSARGLTL